MHQRRCARHCVGARVISTHGQPPSAPPLSPFCMLAWYNHRLRGYACHCQRSCSDVPKINLCTHCQTIHPGTHCLNTPNLPCLCSKPARHTHKHSLTPSLTHRHTRTYSHSDTHVRTPTHTLSLRRAAFRSAEHHAPRFRGYVVPAAHRSAEGSASVSRRMATEAHSLLVSLTSCGHTVQTHGYRSTQPHCIGSRRWGVTSSGR